MKVGERSPAVSTRKTESTQSPQTSQPTKTTEMAFLDTLRAALATPAVGPSTRTTATTAAFTATTQKAPPTQAMLPPSSTVLSPDRMTRAVDTAIRAAAAEGYPIPGGVGRNDLYQYALKMQKDGCNDAGKMEAMLTSLVREMRFGPLFPKSEADFKSLTDMAFRRAYDNEQRGASPEEYGKYRELATKMAAEGKTFMEIMYAISDKEMNVRFYGGPPDSDTAIGNAIDKAFKRAHDNPDYKPSEADVKKYWDMAKTLAAEGKDSGAIMSAIGDKISNVLAFGGDPDSDTAIGNAIDKAFKRAYDNPNRPTTEQDKKKYWDIARQLAAEGKDSAAIMYAISDKITNVIVFGGAPDSDVALGNAIDKAFKRAYDNPNRPTTLQEKQKYWELAKKLAAEGKDSAGIMYAVADKIQNILVFGGEPDSNTAIEKAIDKAFKRAYDDASRPTSRTETDAYRQMAKDLAAEGKDSTAILYIISDKIKDRNQYGGDPTDRHVQDGIIERSLRAVLEGAYRPALPKEQDAWRALIAEWAKEGKLSGEIEAKLRSELQVSYYNL